nr:unnamed protein product [Digitaria exilis]
MKGHQQQQQQQHSSPLLLPPKRRCTTLAAAVPALVVCSVLLPLVFLLGLHRPGAHPVLAWALGIGSARDYIPSSASLNTVLPSAGYGSEERAAVVITTELAGVGARNKQHLENGGAMMKHKLLKQKAAEEWDRDPKSGHLVGAHSYLKSGCIMSVYPLRTSCSRRQAPAAEDLGVIVRVRSPTSSQTAGLRAARPLQLVRHRAPATEVPRRLRLDSGAVFDDVSMAPTASSDNPMASGPATSGGPMVAREEKTEADTHRQGTQRRERAGEGVLVISDGPHTPKKYQWKDLSLTSGDTVVNGKENHDQETVHEGIPKSCENEYGSYCIWSTEHREVMKDDIDSGSIVFHLFTDAQNFYAMEHWFNRNSYLEATVHVINIEDHQNLSKDADSLEMQQIWPSEEFRVTIRNYSEPSQRQMRTEYISVFGHSQYLLPDLLPSLNRVVVLDDDLVVQKDLSSLWNIDMDGKVIGAIQFCGLTLGQLRSYIAEHNFNSDACVWLSGLNVIELEKWRDLRLTSLYDQSLQKLQKERLASKRLKALPTSILAFQDLIYPLEDSWVQSGLGHNYGISRHDIEKAATLHYNGVMKPWLDLGIHDYKSYWRKYMATGEKFMTECNIH